MSVELNEADRSQVKRFHAENPQTFLKSQHLVWIARSTLLMAIVACAAVAGFFYAYACSVMYGLNDSAPAVALEAMQGINRTVRNPIFALSFFGTALLLPLAAALTYIVGSTKAGAVLAISAIVYIGGGFVLTMAINVPMNNALAIVDVSALANPAKAWADYEGPWSFWNWTRTGFSFLALLMAILTFGFGARQA